MDFRYTTEQEMYRQEIARADLSMSTPVYTLLTIGWSYIINRSGTDELKQEVLPAVAAGKAFAGINTTEPGCCCVTDVNSLVVEEGELVAGRYAFGAVVGCTKSLADLAWLGEDRIIGLSGAKTAPDLYLSVGVSGQIQHTVGVSAAKLIAAVNKDKEAPIIAMADYGIVGDLYEVLPALTERLKSV